MSRRKHMLVWKTIDVVCAEAKSDHNYIWQTLTLRWVASDSHWRPYERIFHLFELLRKYTHGLMASFQQGAPIFPAAELLSSANTFNTSPLSACINLVLMSSVNVTFSCGNLVCQTHKKGGDMALFVHLHWWSSPETLYASGHFSSFHHAIMKYLSSSYATRNQAHMSISFQDYVYLKPQLLSIMPLWYCC